MGTPLMKTSRGGSLLSRSQRQRVTGLMPYRAQTPDGHTTTVPTVRHCLIDLSGAAAGRFTLENRNVFFTEKAPMFWSGVKINKLPAPLQLELCERVYGSACSIAGHDCVHT
jgi:hypothetical protein